MVASDGKLRASLRTESSRCEDDPLVSSIMEGDGGRDEASDETASPLGCNAISSLVMAALTAEWQSAVGSVEPKEVDEPFLSSALGGQTSPDDRSKLKRASALF